MDRPYDGDGDPAHLGGNMKRFWKLGIFGIIAFATVAFAADKYITSSGDVVIKTAVSQKVNLQDTLYTTQAGNVGVGKNDPTSKLQVLGTGTAPSLVNNRVFTASTDADVTVAMITNGNAALASGQLLGLYSKRAPSSAFSFFNIVAGDDTNYNARNVFSVRGDGYISQSLGLNQSGVVQQWMAPTHDTVRLAITGSQVYFGTVSTTRLDLRTGDTDRLRIDGTSGKTELSVRSDSSCGIGNVCSGEFTPGWVCDIGANCNAASNLRTIYARIGNVVTVSANVNLDSAGGATSIYICGLPGRATNFADANRGSGSCANRGNEDDVYVMHSTTGSSCMKMFAGSPIYTSAENYACHFTYQTD